MSDKDVEIKVIARAHLRTLAKMIVVINPFDTTNAYSQNVNDLIAYAIENPTKE